MPTDPTQQLSGPGLRQMRIERKWSLRELANSCDALGRPITYTQVGKIERGDCRSPRPSTLHSLALVFNASSIADLVRRSHEAAGRIKQDTDSPAD